MMMQSPRSRFLSALSAWLPQRTKRAPAQRDVTSAGAAASAREIMLAAAEELLERSGIMTILVFEVRDLPEFECVFDLATAKQAVAQISDRLRRLAHRSGLVLRTAPTAFTVLLPRMDPHRALDSAWSVLGDPCALPVGVHGEEIVLEADFALQAVCRDAVPIDEVYDDLRRRIEDARHSGKRIRPTAMLPRKLSSTPVACRAEAA